MWDPLGLNSDKGRRYTAIMELAPQNHNGDGLLGANSIIVMYMDPLGIQTSSSPQLFCLCFAGSVLYVGPTTYLYAARVPATKLHGFRIKILALNPKPWTHGMFTPWAFAAAALHAFALFENGCA